jgi:hypothetical protein
VVWPATDRRPKRLSRATVTSRGAKAYDDFTSSVLRHDVGLDAKRRLAGVSALARGRIGLAGPYDGMAVPLLIGGRGPARVIRLSLVSDVPNDGPSCPG